MLLQSKIVLFPVKNVSYFVSCAGMAKWSNICPALKDYKDFESREYLLLQACVEFFIYSHFF